MLKLLRYATFAASYHGTWALLMATALHSRRMQRLKMHSVMHCTCILPAFRLHQLPVGTALSFAILCVATQAAPCARWTTDHSSSSCAVIQPQGTSAAGSSEHTACAAAVHTLIGTIVAYVETVCALFYTSMLERLPETATCETVCMLSRYALSTAGGLGDIAYVPDFITAEEEAHLLQDIRCSKAKWTVVSGRRLQSHGGSVHAKGLIPAPMPAWMQGTCSKLYGAVPQLYGHEPPNHVLVNEYQPGEGILAHEDGPAYHPGVCILSLASPAIIRFWRKTQGVRGAPDASVLLMPCSLLLFSGEAYTGALHGIDEMHEEHVDASVLNRTALGLAEGARVPRTAARVSLTVRRVGRVIKGLAVGRPA